MVKALMEYGFMGCGAKFWLDWMGDTPSADFPAMFFKIGHVTQMKIQVQIR